MPASALPRSESFINVYNRVVSYWHDTICPQILDDKNVLVVAHNDSIRAITKELLGLTDEEVIQHEVPEATPLVFEFDNDMNTLNHYRLTHKISCTLEYKVCGTNPLLCYQ